MNTILDQHLGSKSHKNNEKSFKVKYRNIVRIMNNLTKERCGIFKKLKKMRFYAKIYNLK